LVMFFLMNKFFCRTQQQPFWSAHMHLLACIFNSMIPFPWRLLSMRVIEWSGSQSCYQGCVPSLYWRECRDVDTQVPVSLAMFIRRAHFVHLETLLWRACRKRTLLALNSSLELLQGVFTCGEGVTAARVSLCAIPTNNCCSYMGFCKWMQVK
jgi:hypothetical protein